MEKCKSKERF